MMTRALDMSEGAAWRLAGCALVLVAAAACSLVPDLDGRKATYYTSDELKAAARKLHDEGRHGKSAEISEYLIRTRFDEPGLEEICFLAGEARFGEQKYAAAFSHYRRLLDQYPFTPYAPVVGKRAWVIGKTLVEKPGRWFGDLSSEADVGVEALNLLVTHYPRSPDADDAWKELARFFARDRHWQAVVDVYERLMRDYPESEWHDFACYEVTKAYRAQSRGAAFDVEPLLRAHGALRRYLAWHPEGNFVAQARVDLAGIEAEVARHELEVAEFYRRTGVADGERIHLANAAGKFPGSLEADAASQELADRGLAVEDDSRELLVPKAGRPPWRRGSEGTIKPGGTAGQEAKGPR